MLPADGEQDLDSSSEADSQGVEDEQSPGSDVEATMEDAIRDAVQQPAGDADEDEDDEHLEDDDPEGDPAPSAEEVVGDPESVGEPAGNVDEDAEFIEMLRKNEVPLGKIERFQELINDRNRFKQENEELGTIRDQLGQIQVAGEQAGLDQEQLTQLFSIPVMMAKDPEAAFEAINSFRDLIAANVGETLPDDIQQKVNDGYMDAESAKELAKTRAAAARAERVAGDAEERSQAERVQQSRNAVVEAVNTFQKTLVESDPDYDQQKHKYVKRELAELAKANPPRTPEEAVALARQAHETVTKEQAALKPKPKPKRTLSGRGTNRSPAAKPATMAEAIAAAVS